MVQEEKEISERVNKATELTRHIWACKLYTTLKIQPLLVSVTIQMITNQRELILIRLKEDNWDYNNKDRFSPSNPREGKNIIKVLNIIKIH